MSSINDCDCLAILLYVNDNYTDDVILKLRACTLSKYRNNIRDRVRDTADTLKRENVVGYTYLETRVCSYLGERTAEIKRALHSTLSSQFNPIIQDGGFWRDDVENANNGNRLIDYFRYDVNSIRLIDRFFRTPRYNINLNVDFLYACNQCGNYVNVNNYGNGMDSEPLVTCKHTNDDQDSEEHDCGFHLHYNPRCIQPYLDAHPECSNRINSDNWMCHQCV